MKTNMTKPNYTEIIVLLDRSGSMTAIKADMEGGFNALIEEQKKQLGECTVTLAQFDDCYENVYTCKALAEVPKLTLEPRGMTALLDGMGKVITETGARLRAMPENQRPSKVIMVVITDGAENASKEWQHSRVMNMVKEQKDTYNWEFVFLGAGQDAIAVGNALGITQSYNFTADAAGTKQLMGNVSAGISSYRGGGGYIHGLGGATATKMPSGTTLVVGPDGKPVVTTSNVKSSV